MMNHLPLELKLAPFGLPLNVPAGAPAHVRIVKTVPGAGEKVGWTTSVALPSDAPPLTAIRSYPEPTAAPARSAVKRAPEVAVRLPLTFRRPGPPEVNTRDEPGLTVPPLWTVSGPIV